LPLCALFRLAFATASGVTPLTLRQKVTRRIILRKARRQACRTRRPSIALRLFVSIRFQVLFHSANSRAFHLSLTVLVHYRSPKVFSLGRWTSRLPTGLACPVVLKDTAEVCSFLPTGLSPSMAGLSRAIRLKNRLVTSICGPYNTVRAEARSVWAAPLSLATTQGIISFPQGTKMFQFPWFPPCDL
jgi:hypothetical protein